MLVSFGWEPLPRFFGDFRLQALHSAFRGMSRPRFSLALWASLLVGPLAAEEVLLTSGETLSGRVESQTPGGITVRTARGLQTLAKSQVVRIQYVAFTAAQKQEQRANYVQAVAAYQEQIRKYRHAQMEAVERDRQIAQAQAAIEEEKRKEAQETAERAAALRDLVRAGKFQNTVDEPISYWDFAWRSMVLPGLGHFYLGKPIMGSFYALGIAGLAANAYERRRVAQLAVEENHRQVERNFLITMQPSLLDVNTRVLLSQYANAKAFTHYQGKVNDYHNSLYALQTFYLLQLIHIIYNGIAWENGLLIVKRSQSDGHPRGEMVLAPEQDQRTGRIEGQKIQVAWGWRF